MSLALLLAHAESASTVKSPAPGEGTADTFDDGSNSDGGDNGNSNGDGNNNSDGNRETQQSAEVDGNVTMMGA